MKLQCLGSSSNGNCYILESDSEALIIEVGINTTEIKKALKWRLNKVVGAVISHSHRDHAGYIRELADLGIVALSTQNTLDTYSLCNNPFVKAVIANKAYKVGGFIIQPVEAIHDVPCFSYVITHKEMGKLLFITDTITFNRRVNNLNHIMIEANYSDEIVEDNIERGRLPYESRRRLLLSHLELSQTKSVLSENDLSKVSEIVLLHLSDRNSDEKLFVREITELTGIPTYAAKKGLQIEFNVIN